MATKQATNQSNQFKVKDVTFVDVVDGLKALKTSIEDTKIPSPMITPNTCESYESIIQIIDCLLGKFENLHMKEIDFENMSYSRSISILTGYDNILKLLDNSTAIFASNKFTLIATIAGSEPISGRVPVIEFYIDLKRYCNSKRNYMEGLKHCIYQSLTSVKDEDGNVIDISAIKSYHCDINIED